MNVRKTVKKILALGAGATMVGATIMGAAAYNLAEYPAPFVQDGVANVKIVVGANAATQDVLGAIDIAASLQAAAVTKKAIDIPGLAGEVTLKGDAFRIETGSDLLELREPIGEVYDTLTESELAALKGGSITTDEGTTAYDQYLRFEDPNNSEDLQQIAVNYDEDEDKVLGDYLVIDSDKPFFEWEIEFQEGLESTIDTNNDLDDLEDEVLNIFGTDFTVVDTSIDTTNDDITIELMAGDVSSTMREGETKTFTIDGVEYEVTLIFVSDPNSGGNPEAKFMVNGEVTDSLQDGDTDTLSGGLQIGVRDLLVNSREGVVEFFLGADKIELTDNDYTSDTTDANGEFQSSTIEISNENIEDGSVAIAVNELSSSKVEITSIKYRLKADAKKGSTVYIPPGHGIREYLDEPEGMLSPTFDIRYEGLKKVATTDVKLSASGDDSYDLVLTNLRGKEYDFPFVTNDGGTWKWGDDDDDFWFTEPTVDESGGSLLANITVANFWVGDDDYFVLSEGNSSDSSEKDDSAILQYDDIDTSDQIIYFTDMSTGEQKTVSYTVDTSTNADGLDIGVASNFVVEGQTYHVWVNLNATGYPLAIDLDGNGALTGGQARFTVKGGGILTFAANETQSSNSSAVPSEKFTMRLTTLSSQFDESPSADETLTWTVMSATNEEVDLSVSASGYVGPNEGSDVWDQFKLISDDSNDDYKRAMTDFGAKVEYYSPSGNDDADELTITYPETQVGAQVFVTAGLVDRSESTAGVSADVVNPIAVGLAVLDTNAPAIGSTNMIVVGGPCANTVAAALRGNPAQCGEGFVEGKAMIKAYEKNGKVALLVAGYSAEDTRAASYVLADYADYALSGSEAEVVAADMNNIVVNTVQ